MRPITGNYIGGEGEIPDADHGNISANTIYYGSMSGAKRKRFPNNIVDDFTPGNELDRCHREQI